MKEPYYFKQTSSGSFTLWQDGLHLKKKALSTNLEFKSFTEEQLNSETEKLFLKKKDSGYTLTAFDLLKHLKVLEEKNSDEALDIDEESPFYEERKLNSKRNLEAIRKLFNGYQLSTLFFFKEFIGNLVSYNTEGNGHRVLITEIKEPSDQLVDFLEKNKAKIIETTEKITLAVKENRTKVDKLNSEAKTLLKAWIGKGQDGLHNEYICLTMKDRYNDNDKSILSILDSLSNKYGKIVMFEALSWIFY